jgi:nicotinamide mononucleotide (NMN) deamidase PncC
MVLTLSAIAGCAGLVGANQASAKPIGSVFIKVNGNDTNANAHWGEAWDACRKKYPDTRSAHYTDTHQAWSPGDPENPWWEQIWTCNDQP